VRRSERRVALRRRVGYVGHSSLLYPALTGLENLVLTGRLYGVRNPTDRARALLAELSLEEFGERRVQTFSRGVAQRMAVARALVHEPRVLLFDEPFSGLDPEAAPALEASVEMLMGESPSSEGGRALVLVTHDLPSASRLCHRGLILRAGRHREMPLLGTSETLREGYARLQEELRDATASMGGAA
jgi:heme exporter protein A